MSKDDSLLQMTFGGHLEVLRRMLFRVLGVILVLAIAIYCCKDYIFEFLLAPKEYDFITYRAIEKLAALLGMDFHFTPYHVELINTELSAQFMIHITSSCWLALLAASPYIVFELFAFIAPALYQHEKKYAVAVLIAVYLLFVVGVLMSYFIIFPIAFRFLGTYHVSDVIENTITLSSYISTFTTLMFMMGVVFQLPVLAFILAKLGIINASMLSHYRKHAIMVIMIVSAVITPPDLFTLVLVSIPLYLLYEVSIRIVKRVNPEE